LPPDLPREVFLTRLKAAIEEASDRLVAAGQAEQARLFGGVPHSARA
jgi:1-acyl-sn-glycerol-3-phosphate acyltransferase